MPWPALSTPGGRVSSPTGGGFAGPTMAGGMGGTGISGGMGTSAAGSGGTGSAASSGAAWGHDTHPTWQEPEPERDPSQGFFHDRRKEGRRHAPTFVPQTNGHSPGFVRRSRQVQKRTIKESMALPTPPGRRVTPHQRHLN